MTQPAHHPEPSIEKRKPCSIRDWMPMGERLVADDREAAYSFSRGGGSAVSSRLSQFL